MIEKFKQTKLYLGVKTLGDQLRPMTFKQKCEHLWEYYKEWLLVVFIVCMGISLAVTVISEQQKEVLVSGMLVNISIDQRGMYYLTTEYAQYLGATDKNQVAEVDYTSFGDPLDPEQGENSYYASMILPSRVTGAMLDYIIMDKFAMEYYITQDLYMDLRDFFTPEELEQLEKEKRVIYAQEEGSFDRVPIAVVITQLPFIQTYVAPEGDNAIYFALAGSTPRPEMCRNVWNYLHDWDPKHAQY